MENYKLCIYGDSQLFINQINSDYQTMDNKLILYKKWVDALWNYFTFVTFQQIPRAQNKITEAMPTLTSNVRLQEYEF